LGATQENYNNDYAASRQAGTDSQLIEIDATDAATTISTQPATNDSEGE
jgi:hypothetical protein